MYKIRLATQTDVSSLKQINHHLNREIILERLEKQKEEKADFLLLEIDGILSGYVFLKWTGKPSHPEYPDMEDLYLSIDARGKGYGRLLVGECEKRVMERGMKKIGLSVNPSNYCPAKRLYSKMGYKHDAKKSHMETSRMGLSRKVIDMEKEL